VWTWLHWWQENKGSLPLFISFFTVRAKKRENDSQVALRRTICRQPSICPNVQGFKFCSTITRYSCKIRRSPFSFLCYLFSVLRSLFSVLRIPFLNGLHGTPYILQLRFAYEEKRSLTGFCILLSVSIWLTRLNKMSFAFVLQLCRACHLPGRQAEPPSTVLLFVRREGKGQRRTTPVSRASGIELEH
jgi:hypothetical protein